MSTNVKPNVSKKYRSNNGNPRPYFDKAAGRFKAPAIIDLPNGYETSSLSKSDPNLFR
jgi:hypothetical protein